MAHGVFELHDYAFGSEQIMKHIAKLPATTIMAGDTMTCCRKFNNKPYESYQ